MGGQNVFLPQQFRSTSRNPRRSQQRCFRLRKQIRRTSDIGFRTILRSCRRFRREKGMDKTDYV